MSSLSSLSLLSRPSGKTLKPSLYLQWVGSGRLDLTADTRFLGPRRLVKEGQLSKAKGQKKLNLILTNDILVLTEPSKNLYRMPLPLNEVVLKCVVVCLFASD